MSEFDRMSTCVASYDVRKAVESLQTSLDADHEVVGKAVASLLRDGDYYKITEMARYAEKMTQNVDAPCDPVMEGMIRDALCGEEASCRYRTQRRMYLEFVAYQYRKITRKMN